MEQDKTKILSDLYAIRATMSVVAQNDDEAKVERGSIVDLNNELFEADERIESVKGSLGGELYAKRNAVQQQMDGLQKKCNDKKQSYEKHKGDSNRSVVSYFFESSAGIPVCMVFVVLGVILSFLCGIFWGEEIGYWKGVQYTAILCALVVLIYIVVMAIPVARNNRNNDRRRAAQDWLELQQIELGFNNMIELYEAYSERLKFDGPTYKSAYSFKYQDGSSYYETCSYREVSAPKYHHPEVDGLIKSHEQKVAEMESRKAELEAQKEPHNEVIQAIAKKSQKIIDAAVKTYPLIDFRDWENVDLIIYYFETGRADDMKEALQLVDRQRQTDQITRAIAMASKEICRTFDDSMRRLGSALSQSFGVLSRQMAQQHVELMAGMERQAEEQKAASEAQIREIRAQTAEQRNAQAMNRALIEKISDSSLHLAEQMDRQMREVHDIPV